MSKPEILALVDCNNFFVSCERIFRPDLEGKPVVVLSSNDGCIVARSNEAKALGIPMGAPVFQWRDFFKQQKVTTFSANFEIYGNISKRITAILTELCPRIEVYSIDESFLDIAHLPNIGDGVLWAREVRARCQREIGVPVSIGIAPSKTLAKLASEYAKTHTETVGVVSFVEKGESPNGVHISDSSGSSVVQPERPRFAKSGDLPRETHTRGGNVHAVWRKNVLASTPIRDVWGVGRHLAPKLRAEGIGNALALSKLRPRHAQQLMGIRGRQLVAELNGVSCYEFAAEHDAAKSIMRSRTFGEDTGELHVLEAAVASLVASGAFALRRNELLARRIGVFMNTNRHKPGYRRWMEEIKLDMPTNDTGLIASKLVETLNELHSGAQKYHRLGVFLYDLVPANSLQTDLLGLVNVGAHDRASARMAAIDFINKRHGKGKLHFAAEDLSSTWRPKREIRSPRYVSAWDELPEARIMDAR